MPIIKKICPICQKEFVIREGRVDKIGGYWTKAITIIDTQNYILHLLEEHIIKEFRK
jgi:hypothetical protein